ncbi:MAG: hypothetical protein AAF160_05580 [Pseudomonadota bacterium]
MTETAAERRRMSSRAAADEVLFSRRRQRDAAMALPFLGVLLLASPLVYVVAVDATIFGVPLVVAYVFIAWALLIMAARVVGRRILAAAEAEERGVVPTVRRRQP